MNRIPVFAPCIEYDMRKHIEDALDVGWLGMGAYTKEFEERISAYLGLSDRCTVATNTGTSALHMALRAAKIGRGDEVITPSFNYVADHQAIKMAGADVVMCDIREDNLGIDCDKMEKLITKRTKAIIPLYFAGIPYDQKRTYEIAQKYGLRIIEDCCHAFGTTIQKRKVGSYGDIACFSFDPVKTITSIDGGCIIADKEILDDLHHLRFLGVDKDTNERYKNKRSWDYDVVSEGYRYHLTNIMASVGISQIKRIDEFIASRRKTCQKYSRAFGNIEGVQVPHSDFENVSPFIYSLRILDGKREELIRHLDTLGIDCGIHFVPVHKHAYFSADRRGDMTVTDMITQQVLTLPLHSNMKTQDSQRIIDGVLDFFKA